MPQLHYHLWYKSAKKAAGMIFLSLKSINVTQISGNRNEKMLVLGLGA
jgi:hypothetical protein